MRKIFAFTIFFLLVASVSAISFYAVADFKGTSGIFNVTNITFSDNTVMTTAATSGFSANATSNLNMSGYNITNVNCIVYSSGGMDCSQ